MDPEGGLLKRIGDWRLDDELSRGGEPFVVLFSEAGTHSGQDLRRVLRTLAAEYFQTRFFELDLAENPARRVRFEIDRVPTVIVFANGAEVLRDAEGDPRALLRRALGREPSPSAGNDDVP